MADRTLLVIDDEAQIRRVVGDALATDFEELLEAATGALGIEIAAIRHPDLVILDLGLPDMSGTDVCKALRKSSNAPILVLSARHSEDEKVRLLDAGADDYVTKPFSTSELKARVRALLRRAGMHVSAFVGTMKSLDLEMDLEKRTLTNRGEYVHLTPTEWELLRVLITAGGKTLTHRQLFAAVWMGREFGDAQQYLRVHIANLRRKIEMNPLDPHYIVTEPGVGYRFAAPTTEAL